jgi:hypothetical protein
MPLFSQHNSECFNTWTKICQSVGGQAFELSAATSNFESILEFLAALENSDDQPVYGSFGTLAHGTVIHLARLHHIFVSRSNISETRHFACFICTFQRKSKM